MPPVIRRFRDTAALSADLSQTILQLSKEAINKRNKFTVAFSGGSLPKTVASGLLEASAKNVDFQFGKWWIFYADERCVDHEHAESNHRLVTDELLQHLGIPANQIVAIDPQLVNSPDKAATDYESRLMKALNCSDASLASLDLVLLGMGPDAHTCSLFPGHRLLDESTKLIGSLTDSPKPPPERITFTLPLLNRSHTIIYVATGASKQEILKQVFAEKDGNGDLKPRKEFPVSLVKAAHVHWFLDEPAAALL